MMDVGFLPLFLGTALPEVIAAPIMPEFKGFPKIPRFNRPVICTEKLDGTNACVIVTEDRQVYAQSRNRVITPEKDNYGFARWVDEHKEELVNLGPGYHYGEWMGSGIQRRYGLTERRFYLFRNAKWAHLDTDGVPLRDCDIKNVPPMCCRVVPIVYQSQDWEGPGQAVEWAMTKLATTGSVAVPGWMDPEGIVVYHTHSGHMFKVTCNNDSIPKSEVAK